MAPRKRELLDVLRRSQQSPEVAERPAPPPAAPRAAPFRFRFGPSQRRAWLRVGFVLLWTVLIVWLVRLLLRDGDAPPAVPAAGAPPSRPPPAAEAPAVVASAPKPAAPVYGVLAITYQGESQRSIAQSVGRRMQDELQLPDVSLQRTEERGKVWYELYVGRAADSATLAPLLQRVRGLTLPGESGKPFASAYVRQLPSTDS